MMDLIIVILALTGAHLLLYWLVCGLFAISEWSSRRTSNRAWLNDATNDHASRLKELEPKVKLVESMVFKDLQDEINSLSGRVTLLENPAFGAADDTEKPAEPRYFIDNEGDFWKVDGGKIFNCLQGEGCRWLAPTEGLWNVEDITDYRKFATEIPKKTVDALLDRLTNL